jgi:PAS domain S-box-containing protein
MSAVILDSTDGTPRTRVFIVEDEALIAMEVQDRLGALGYAVCGLASRGEQALDAIAERVPDIVLMDVRLAGTLSGIETAERLRERLDVPVIFLSAYSDADLLRRAGEVLPFGYLVKPFEERELHATIQMAIYKHRMERALREAYARLDEKVQERTAELAQSRQDLAVTLDSIGDAVLATDATGHIARMNPAAEQLTGWSLNDAVGLPIEQVFLIINEQTREPAVIPVDAVLRTGQKQMLANHTALITRSGAEISIADSAAPIRNAAGDIVGVVLVFRDETEARERRALITRQRTIAEALRRVQQRFISSPDASAPIEDILSVLLFATSSDSGFIGEVRAAPDDSPFLEIQSATGGPWDLHVPLVDQAITTGKVATQKGAAFIAVPILVSDKVVGVVGVANRVGGYNDSVLAEIQPLLATYGSLIEARRSALRRRAAEESLQQLNASLESEVQRRAATFETLATLSPVGIVRMDASAQCLYVNQRYCEMLGVTREAALGFGWTRTALHPDDRERVMAEWQRTLELGQPYYGDCRFVRPDGQTVSVLVQTVPTMDTQGTVAGYIGTLTDVTEQKLMEQALRVLSTELVALEGTAFFRRMVQQLATLLECEISVVAGVKIEEKELVLQTLAVYEDGEFTADFACPLSKSPWTQDTLDRAVVIPSGVRAPSPFLTTRNVEGFAAVPLIDHAGACIGQLAVMSRRTLANPERFEAILHVFAISATAHIEQQRSARRFHDLFEFSPDAIVMTDRSGTIRLVNRKAEAMFGWSRDELVGQSVEQLIPEEDRAKHVLQHGGAELTLPLAVDRPNLQARRKDGTVFPVEIGLGSIETGEGLMIAAAVRDITERRNAERQANRARRLESIGTLAGGIAHDLNNALTPILLTLDLLKQQYPTEHETLDTVEHSANHAAEMVRHLLAFAKGSEGKRISLSPRRLLEEMEKIVKGTFPKSIQVRIRVPRELPTVLGDATQLHQVLLNLCVNARDAMPEGGNLTLEAESLDGAVLADLPTAGDAPPARCVVLRVTDTGTGIAPEVLERIFDPFFTTKEPESGTGLGLFTVAGIVKGHGGLVRVTSQPGRGSTFAVLLPAEERNTEAAAAPPSAPSNLEGHGELILYVDDEVTVRDAARSVLERLQFTPITASDGMSGLVQAVQHRSGLYAVITDLHMPHMDGLAFVRALRKLLPNIPIIVASGRLEPAPAQELRKLGVQVMLEKPFTQEKLASALQAAVKQGA